MHEQPIENSLPPTVFVVEDEPIVRQAVCSLAESMGLKAQGFETAEDFLEGFDREAVGCIVADIRLRGMSGVELLEKLGEMGRKRPMVIITGFATTPTVVRAMRHGAVTVLDKPFDTNALWEAIQEGIRADLQGRAQAIHMNDLRERFSKLTLQERMVLQLMVNGYINKQISRLLDVSVRTVESRRQQIFLKTGAKNLGELMWHAMQLKADGFKWLTDEEENALKSAESNSIS